MTKVTKPILLDETGRAINETLERIRQTIDQRNKVDWGEIEGLLADQADLVAEFDKKENKHILLKHCDSTSGQEVLAEVFDVVSEHVGQGFRWAYEGGEDRIYPTLFVTGNSASVAFAYTETRLIDDSYVTEVVIAKITLIDGLYQYEEKRTELLSKEVAEGRFVDFSSDQNVQGVKNFVSGLTALFSSIKDNETDKSLSELLGEKASVISLQEVTSKIPAQASADNQLADKAFVNSSIATNTANFIGTFNSLEELEEYPTTDLTNNDYAFVIGSDGEGNTQYSRYKWTGTGWLFEYVLNNSSFTEVQWAAINSGLTGNDVTALRSALTLIGNVIPNDASAINKLVTRQYMEDRHIILPLLTLEATQEQLEGVYNAILNAPTGSAFFISLPEGRGIMPLATAIGGTSVFAQYADGRYSHELKITLADGVYLFEKVDKTFATTADLNDYVKVVDIPIEKGEGENSVVQKGGENKAQGEKCVALGDKCETNGTCAFAFGIGLFINGLAATAFGRYNVFLRGGTRATNTFFALGNGDNDNSRKNLFEIMQNGDIYVVGLGNYNGTNAGQSGVKTLQQILRAITI